MADFYVENIKSQTLYNFDSGPKIIYEDPSGYIQIGLMSIIPGEKVKMETHKRLTQFVRVEQGLGVVHIGGIKKKISTGMAFVVPAGVPHMILSSKDSYEALKMYTIYSKNVYDDFEH